MSHEHFIQRCCLEALFEDVLGMTDTIPEAEGAVGWTLTSQRERAEAVFELVKMHLAEAWEPTEEAQ